MKQQILALRQQGKSYREIEKLLQCSKGLIAYHLGDGQKQKTLHRTNVLRKKYKQALVDSKGGKCEECGYDKCLSALEFHHLDPNEKDFSVGDCRIFNLKKLLREVKKCKLLCANCHREAHESM